ncbi:MAG: putative C-S lyase [Methylophilaceae bacterium]|nr:putative C-S lyase [Methylophilaceae bacterium]MBL6726690.1 putative C-S lyase [Methylophilaceae bacterium]MBL6790566.1 putative C-S lyase [Methylophilaceae bacterium]
MNNFDQPIDRRNTDSIRWNRYGKDIIPLWVADMDFRSPPCVVEALHKRVEHGVYGYTHEPNDLKEKLVDYIYQQFNWKINKDWIVFIPSVVSGLYSAASNFVKNDETILVPRPVYHHLRWAPQKALRDFFEIDLICENNRIYLNESSLLSYKKKNVKLLMFCNPHNPGGTVYSKKELEGIASFCVKNKILICSDEIHAGMVLGDKKHIPIASISSEISKQTITLMSLNKTFNFPGLGTAWAISENKDLRESISKGIGTIIPDTQIFGYITTLAALDKGEPWRKDLLDYLDKNRKLVQEKIIPIKDLKLYTTEASYLAWISYEKLKNLDLCELFLQYGVAVQPGSMFNKEKHFRLNFATQSNILNEALNRMAKAIKIEKNKTPQ